MKVKIEITRRAGIADPEGTTIERALADLGFTDVRSVHTGRSLVVELDATDPDRAASRATEMCERLLANPVIDDFRVEVVE